MPSIPDAPLSEESLEEIAQLALSHYLLTERMDWHDLLYRAEVALEIDLPEDMADPQIKAIKSYVNKARKTAREEAE